MEYEDLETVYTLADPVKAEIIKNALNAEGVRCFLDGVHQAGEAGLMAFAIKVLVRAGDADRARKLILAHEPNAEKRLASGPHRIGGKSS